MPVTDQTPIIAHTANGVSTAFAFPFLLDQASDLIVMVGDALKTLDTDYTVSGTGNPAGGTVTFTSAPANGVRVVFTRRTALQRLTDYQTGGANRANVLDADLDRLWLALQDGWLGVKQAIRYQNGDNGPTRMPVLKDGQVLGQLGGALVGRDTLPSGDGVNFLQSGPGAVTRSMQDKAREWVSVKDFGAVGDGATDDTSAIQAAINSLSGAGGWIYVPKGTYKVSGTIDLSNGAKLFGDGIGVTKFSATAAMTAWMPMFRANGANYVTLRDFTIMGNTDAVNGAGFGIYLKAGSHNVVTHVYVANTTQAGLRLEEQTYLIIDSNTLDNCGRAGAGYTDNHGLMLFTLSQTPCSHVKITNNVVSNSQRKGIATYSTGGEITDILIQGNSVYGSALGNIFVGGPGHSHISILDNYVYNGYVNMQLYTCAHMTVSGNTLDLSTGDFGLGIFGLINSVITGNVIKNSYTSGIKMWLPYGAQDNCYEAIISSNIVTDSNQSNTGFSAIQLQGANHCSLIGNTIYDSTPKSSYGIYEFVGVGGYNHVIDNKVFNMVTGKYLISESTTYLEDIGGNGGKAIGASHVSSKFEVTQNNAATAHSVTQANGGNWSQVYWSKGTSGDNAFVGFYTDGGQSFRGSIDFNRAGGLIRYNTSSDATLKNIIGDADPAKSLDILDRTRLRSYSWKHDQANKPQIGVIAQELVEVYPGAVSVGGDVVEVDADGNETTIYKPWAVDKTAWVFHLIAGYQHQKKQIAALEARVAALEAI